jgi:hypothetical protein
MEQRFDHDFSRVRVHSGAVAEQSAQDVDAQAYTMGHDIVFVGSNYAPGTHEGQRLLAHELTHVVQQSRSGVSALQMKRGGSERGKSKKRTVLVIHAQAGSTEGASAFVSGEAEPVPIKLTFNALTDGDYTLVKRDVPETELVEYTNENGSPAGFTWTLPKGFQAAERVRVKIQAQEFDLAEFAQAEFDAVDPHLKERLSKRGGQRLTTPEAKLGFSYFAKELKARGVTEEELILYQAHHRGGVNPRDRFDWANNWKEAVDEILGARGELEKIAVENAENFATTGAAFTGLSDEAYEAYRISRLLSGYKEAAEEQFKEAGSSLAEFEVNRDLLLEMFDLQLRRETFAVLAKFEGGLLLTKERLVDNKEGRRQIDLARQAADRDDVKLLKSQSEDAARDRDAAERAYLTAVQKFYFSSPNLYQLAGLQDMPSPEDAMKSAEKLLAAKKAAAEEARQQYLNALQFVSGVPVASWRGFDVDQFFFGASADRSAEILTRYIARKLSSVDRARKELQKDERTIYKADMMVALTKERLNVQPGSLVDKIVADRVEEYKSIPWWERLLDVLSLALMFVPGAAILRVAASTASLILTADNEAQSEVLFDAQVKSEGGSLGNVALSGVGLLGDVGDVAKAVKGVGGATEILSHADEAAKVVSETADVATAAGSKVLSHADEAGKAVSETADVATAGSKVEQSAAKPAGSALAPTHPVTPHGEPPPPAGQPLAAAGPPTPEVVPSSRAAESPVATEVEAAEDVAAARPPEMTPTPATKAPVAEVPAAPSVRAPTSQPAGRAGAAATDASKADARAAVRAERDAARKHLDEIRAKPPVRGSVGEGWDHARFPDGPRRRWKPGDPPDMPTGGKYPSWDTIRQRVWKNLAHNELALRRSGQATRETRALIDLNPVSSLSDRGLRDILRTGVGRAGFEIEHARIPQRVGRMLEEAGLPRNEARRLSHLGDPTNLEPTAKEWHAVVDEAAAKWTGRNPTLPMSIDERIAYPLGSMQNVEVEELLESIAKHNVDLGASDAGRRLRAALESEKERRGTTWVIP